MGWPPMKGVGRVVNCGSLYPSLGLLSQHPLVKLVTIFILEEHFPSVVFPPPDLFIERDCSRGRCYFLFLRDYGLYNS